MALHEDRLKTIIKTIKGCIYFVIVFSHLHFVQMLMIENIDQTKNQTIRNKDKDDDSQGKEIANRTF